MNYPLRRNKESNILTPQSTSYSDEYTRTMYDLYLTDELERDEEGHMKKFYRLHARYDHSQEMAFAYTVKCPRCSGELKQIGRQLTLNELGLYTCPACNRR